MKKLLSVFMAFIIIILSFVAVPAYGENKLDDNGMYDVTQEVYAGAYMLINLDDDSYPVIASKNASVKKYPASLTKIVTAIVTINSVQDVSEKTVVSKSAIESLYGTGAQVAGLKIGDEITVEELLYLTMVHSACDACQVLAEYIGGNVETFVDMMNEWCKEIGCENTHFVNPDGLHDDDHYTTAKDMALITLKALENETFSKISSTQQYKYKNQNFIHTNFMLDKYHVTYFYEYAQGIKTGSTSQAGYCVITKASKNGYNYLAVVMDSPIKRLEGYDTKCSFIDAKTLFDWAFDALKYSTLIRKNDVVCEVAVEDGKDADTIQLVSDKDITTLVPTSLDPSAVIIEAVDPPAVMKAPITQGDRVCSANIIYGDKIIATANLVAAQSVELSTFLKIMNGLKAFFTNKIVIAVIVLVVVLFALYLYLFIRKTQKKKKRLAEKRRRQEELDKELGEHRRDNFYMPPPKR